MSRPVECQNCGCLIEAGEEHDCPADDEGEWVAADEWAAWMFPGQFLPRFEDLPKVRGAGPRRPLHERMQDVIDCLNQTGTPRWDWMSDLRLQIDGGERQNFRITDFEFGLDGECETRDDLADAARMFLAGEDYSIKTEALDEVTRRDAARDQSDWDEVDWEELADDLQKNDDSPFSDEVFIHPSVYPGDARTLAEGEALVGTHPKHETLEELPGPCILCGADEVFVTVMRNPDGDIEETTLNCQECGWRVTGGPE